MGILDSALTIGSILAALLFITFELLDTLFQNDPEFNLGILFLGLLVVMYGVRDLRTSSNVKGE